MSDQQRDALYRQTFNSFETRYVNWLASLDINRLNLRHVTRRSLLATYLPPSAFGLAQATQAADQVMHGRVVAIRPTAFDGTYVSVHVVRPLKGRASGDITVHQPGGLQPTPDWSGVIIVDAESMPLMLPGDDVFLCLQNGVSGYEPQSFTGIYWNTPTGIAAVSGNPFAKTVRGLSPERFESTITSLAG